MQESGQMYLETVYILSKRGGVVRAVDVGEFMGYSKPSVSRAMGLLKKCGYVTADEDGSLSLTAEGLSIAEKMFERHTLLAEFLVHLGVDPDTADADACKIEHHLSDTSFEAIKRHAERVLK